MEVLWYGAIGIAVGAGWTDWHTRRIPNWLTLSGFLVGVLVNVWIFRWAGAKDALAGAGVALALLLPLVLLRGIGAGDWKLMGTLGAFLGPMRVLLVLWGAALLAGIAACVMITRTRRWGSTLRNVWDLLRGFVVFGLRPNPRIHLQNPQLLALPFGTVVAVATPVCYWGVRLLAKT